MLPMSSESHSVPMSILCAASDYGEKLSDNIVKICGSTTANYVEYCTLFKIISKICIYLYILLKFLTFIASVSPEPFAFLLLHRICSP